MKRPNLAGSGWWPALHQHLPRPSHSPHPYRAARGRLVVVNLMVVAGILALMAVAVYAWEVHATDQQVNDQLHERAAHAIVEASSTDGRLDSHPGTSTGADRADGSNSAAEQYEPMSPDVFTVIVSRAGVVTFDPGNVRSLGLPDAAALQPVLIGRQSSTLVTLGDDQNAFRLYSTPIRQHGQIVGALQVGMSLAARYRQLHDLLLILAAVGSGVLVVTAAASFYLAGRALQPMRDAYERQRRFAAAASHELRTPLAILRSEAELVARGLQRLVGSAEPIASTAHALPLLSVGHRSATMEASANKAGEVVGRSSQLSESGGRAALVTDGLAARLGEDMQEIVAEVDYMARLVDDLLLLARDETAPGQFVKHDVDLVAVASEALAKLAPIAHTSGLTLRIEQNAEGADNVPGVLDTLVIHGDRDRLKQLMLILLDNAIRYTPEGGTVEITVHQVRERHLVPRHLPGHGDQAVLSVRDSGVGIAPEDLPHLFEPFYRAKSTRAGGSWAGKNGTGGNSLVGKTEGAGLGLAVARWIVHAHGGTITVASVPGQGAIFTVFLPLG